MNLARRMLDKRKSIMSINSRLRDLFERGRIGYKFDAIYDAGTVSAIEFGEFKGRNKFAKLLDVPTQEMRDSLLHLIFYQGDTEFGSSEQQRKLIDTAPSDYDRRCLLATGRQASRARRERWR